MRKDVIFLKLIFIDKNIIATTTTKKQLKISTKYVWKNPSKIKQQHQKTSKNT